VLAAIAMAVYRRLRRRSDELRALAALYRWTFAPDSPDLVRRWRGTPFGSGSAWRATEVFTGSHRGHHFAAFTYSFLLSAAAKPQVFTVYALSTGHRVPTVEFTPAGSDPPPAQMGGQTVEFASADFNRAWTVTAGNRSVAHGIVGPGLVAWLMRADHAIPLRFEGSDIVTWRAGRLRPATIMPMLDALVEVARLVPHYVREALTATEVRPPHREAVRRASQRPILPDGSNGAAAGGIPRSSA
ncbi:MAG: hypothetical protein LBJ08_10470, partial [Bifidobacteriaceae bacterium]|nr:hypothetical protein [Bifidobacteriaceae bacterium]